VNVFIALTAAACGYLLGAISFARVVGTLVAPNRNIAHTQAPLPDSKRTFQMHGVSATSIRLQLGPRLGCLTSFLDMVKVAAPVLLFKVIFPEQLYFLIVAAMGVIGHNWPVYHRFKGGYGSSPTYGGLVVIDWLGLLVSVGATAVVFGISRDFYVALIGGLMALIPYFWLHTHRWEYVLYALVVNLAYLAMIIPDICRSREARRQPISES
jgi:glycerol-3-phosphate acyltransferase PlsY